MSLKFSRIFFLIFSLLGFISSLSYSDEPDESYWREYEDRYHKWLEELYPDPYFFFKVDEWEKDPMRRDYPMVIATYTKRLGQGEPWSMAISENCETGHNFESDKCHPQLRFVRYKKGSPKIYPKSIDEMAGSLGKVFSWMEADLRNCPGAIKQLQQLDDAPPSMWSKSFRELLSGKHRPLKLPDEIVVPTGDGDSIFVKATGVSHPGDDLEPSINQTRSWSSSSHSGFSYQWTEKMLRIVQPCLKPSSAPKPWENALEAHHQWEKEADAKN